MPGFDLEGGLPLTLLRAGTVTFLLSAFGTLVFGVAVAPRAFAGAAEAAVQPAWRALARLGRASLLGALAFALAWMVAELGRIAGVAGPEAALAATPKVLTGTVFGHTLAAGVMLLVLALAVLGRHPTPLHWRGAALACGAALCLHAAHSHAMAMQHGPSLLLTAQVVHLLAAGAWLGGVLPLLLVVWRTPPRTAAAACRWFSPLGKCCIAGIVASAIWQFCALIGGAVAMIGTAHGWMDAAKTALLVALLGFALCNRYLLAPALRAAEPASARRALLRSLALQTATGVLVVFVAAVLSGLPPGIHEQPLWPFAWRPGLAALEDADLRREVGLAAIVALAGLAVAACGLLLRRFRLGLCVAGVAIVAAAIPHFDLLLVPAYPTSFYRSPSGFTAQSIAMGADLYPAQCASCHGAHGQGDGAGGQALAVPPADLTAAHLWDHSDGELFWWLSHGMQGPGGEPVMPGFADRLSEDERWALIDAIRANNAGMALGDGRAWPRPTPAPRFEADCVGGGSVDLADLKGEVARIVVAGAANAPALSPLPGLVTILIGADSPDLPDGTCADSDPATRLAYALVAGVPRDGLAGTQILIDADGWLRRLWRPGDPPGWTAAPDLAPAVARLRREPLAAPAADTHAHHH